MKKFAMAAMVLAGSAVMATTGAMADVGAGLIGNTVVLTGPDGGVTKVFYTDASSFESVGPDGTAGAGSWRVNGNTICTLPAGGEETCTQAIEEAPAIGSSGVIPGEAGDLKWAVSAGKGF